MKVIVALMLLGLAAVNCSQPKCTKQNGGWSEYLRWSPCSVSCGEGTKRRHRYCDNPIPKYGGAKCSGDNFQEESCNMGPCPKVGTPGEFEYVGTCSKPCNGGKITKRRTCVPPTDNSGATCYQDCSDLQEIEEDCNTKKCFDVDNICQGCKRQADYDANRLGEANFVGHACRISKGKCDGKNGGIRDMYSANDWFFIHCSPDGPWCKPCAVRTLVHNPKCGQCESTRDGPCTGPNKWQKNTKKSAKDVLDDKDLW